MPQKVDGEAPFVFANQEIRKLLSTVKTNDVHRRRFDLWVKRVMSRNDFERRYWYSRSGYTVEAWSACIEEIIEKTGPPFKWTNRIDKAHFDAQLFAAEQDLGRNPADLIPHGLAKKAIDTMVWSDNAGCFVLGGAKDYPFTFSTASLPYRKWIKTNFVDREQIERIYIEHHGELRYEDSIASSGPLTYSRSGDPVFRPSTVVECAFPREGAEDGRGDRGKPVGEDSSSRGNGRLEAD